MKAGEAKLLVETQHGYKWISPITSHNLISGEDTVHALALLERPVRVQQTYDTVDKALLSLQYKVNCEFVHIHQRQQVEVQANNVLDKARDVLEELGQTERARSERS